MTGCRGCGRNGRRAGSPSRIDLLMERRYTYPMVEQTQRRLAAIVSADVVGYSRLMGVDEDGTLAALRAHRAELIDPKIAEYGGRIVKTMGDGLLLEFPSVVNAVKCVIEVQQGMAERNADVDDDRRITFRVGVNQGDIIIEGDDIHGDGVNVAARLQGIAEPGGVSISHRVYEDVRNRLDAVFEDTGEQNLKNIARSVRVWRWTPGTAAAVMPKTNDPVSALLNKPSIAVLPFENLSGDLEQEYFADGMTEDIITELSRFEDLFVTASNTSFAYKGQRVDVKTVSQELGVRFVLEGSVRKVGQRVRITAQLIDGQNGNHLWAERYDGALEEIFDLQEQVTRTVAGNIAPNITIAELERVERGETVFDKAHDLAWRSQDARRSAMRHRDPSMLDRAIGMAIEAAEMNAKCAVAYQVICMGYFMKSLNRWGDDPSASADLAEKWANRFFSELPNSYMAYLYLGMARFRKGQNQDANRDFQQAHDLNPNDPVVLWLWANCEARAGEFERAKEHANLAISLSPKKETRVGAAYAALATVAFFERNFEDLAAKAIQAQPYNSPPRVLMVAYAAETGNQPLLETHRAELTRYAPDFVGSLFRGENQMFQKPELEAILLDGLRKAGFSE